MMNELLTKYYKSFLCIHTHVLRTILICLATFFVTTNAIAMKAELTVTPESANTNELVQVKLTITNDMSNGFKKFKLTNAVQLNLTDSLQYIETVKNTCDRYCEMPIQGVCEVIINTRVAQAGSFAVSTSDLVYKATDGSTVTLNPSAAFSAGGDVFTPTTSCQANAPCASITLGNTSINEGETTTVTVRLVNNSPNNVEISESFTVDFTGALEPKQVLSSNCAFCNLASGDVCEMQFEVEGTSGGGDGIVKLSDVVTPGGVLQKSITKTLFVIGASTPRQDQENGVCHPYQMPCVEGFECVCALTDCSTGGTCKKPGSPLGGPCTDTTECSVGICDGGTCKSEPGGTCSTTAECKEGTCEGGICKSPPGGTCSVTSDCKEGVCNSTTCASLPGGTCSVATDCKEGTCENGICKSPPGGACSATTDCKEGTCEGNICKSPPGGTCSITADCKEGTCEGNICKSSLGGNCSKPEDCLEGACNTDGKCVKSPPGGTCSVTADCLEGTCEGTICKSLPGGTCSIATDCKEGTCEGNICKSPPGGSCSTSAGCQEGTCEGSICKSPPGGTCSADTDCKEGSCEGTTCKSPPGGTCSVTTDCQVGICGTDKICTKSPPGGTCSTSADCTEGTCEGNICKSAPGGTCAATTDCKEGTCEGSICKSPPGGTCAATTDCKEGTCEGSICKSPPGGTCSADTDCKEGTCIDGACKNSGLSTGDTCDANNLCADGLQCISGICKAPLGGTCSADTDCQAGKCISGKCTNDGVNVGEACDANNTCATGLECISGTCKAPLGGACSADTDCKEGTCIDGACKNSDLNTGDTCDTNNLCTNGLQCISGICKAPLGGTCSADTDCQAGKCISGKCTNDGVNVGEACDANNTCATGLECISGTCKAPLGGACSADTDCKESTCIDGACKNSDLNTGDTCDTNNLCTNGLQCISGICKAPLGGTCSTDTDCQAGKCISGKCTNDGVNVGEACDANNTCATGLECISGTCKAPLGGACSADTDCKEGTCIDGACKNSDLNTGDTCDTNNLCADGLQCISGICKAPLGGTCSADTDCQAGKCINGTCTNDGVPVGGTCDANNTCATGLDCINGSCKAPIGGTCTQKTDCQEGDCVNGTCANTNVPVGSGCDNNNLCSDGLNCVNGTCQAPLGGGCTQKSDCQEGDCVNGVCSNTGAPVGSNCDDNNLCADGLSCVNGTCQAPLGGGCTQKTDCQEGDCVNGTCANTNVPVGSGCDNNNLCSDGLNCVNGTCQAPLGGGCTQKSDCQEGDCVNGACTNINVPVGSGCNNNNLCADGLNCINGVCKAPIGSGCTKKSDCQEGDCVNGTCIFTNLPIGEGCNDYYQCASGLSCYNNVCVECVNNSSCDTAGTGKVCLSNFTCGFCTSSTQCPDGQVCKTTTRLCEPGCESDNQCASTELCFAGECKEGDWCFDNYGGFEDTVPSVGDSCVIEGYSTQEIDDAFKSYCVIQSKRICGLCKKYIRTGPEKICETARCILLGTKESCKSTNNVFHPPSVNQQ